MLAESLRAKSTTWGVVVAATDGGVRAVGVVWLVMDLCLMQRSSCLSKRLESCSKKVRCQVVRMARTLEELTADLEMMSLTELVAAKMSRLMFNSLAATKHRDLVIRWASAIR